ncbi:MAG: DUF2752 domain-containing protein [Pirellulales bacterium]|nr:DUF2752 domain-containing protein [Pirellulales bacterium]
MPGRDSRPTPSCTSDAASLSSRRFSSISSTKFRASETSRALPPRLRFGCGLAGLGLLALLCVAAWLTPNARGLGTHQQLGLPPCTFLTLFGQRCPACGMTTAWAHAVRGQFAAAAAANLGGTLLAVAAALGAPWLLAVALRGRWLLGVPREEVLAVGAGVFVALTLLDWAVRCAWR